MFNSPLVVSLSLIMKEPTLFPETSSCLSASFLLTPVKNQLKDTHSVQYFTALDYRCALKLGSTWATGSNKKKAVNCYIIKVNLVL